MRCSEKLRKFQFIHHSPNVLWKAQSSMPIQLLVHTFLLDVTLQLAALNIVRGCKAIKKFKQKYSRPCIVQLELHREAGSLKCNYLERGSNISSGTSVFTTCRRNGNFGIAAHSLTRINRWEEKQRTEIHNKLILPHNFIHPS